MKYCHAWLTCNSIQSIQRHGRIGGGLVKEVLLTTSIIKKFKVCVFKYAEDILNVIYVYMY